MRSKNNFLKKLEDYTQKDMGISIRELSVSGKTVYVSYLPSLTDKQSLSDNIIKPILQYNKKGPINIDALYGSVLYAGYVSLDEDENKLIDYILNGRTVIIIPGESRYITADTYKTAERNINIPQVQMGLNSPLDSFNENIDTNLSLIRYRIKDSSLRVKNFIIGKRTKTRVAVLYIHDVINEKYLNEIEKRLKAIKIDGVIESGYLHKFLLNNAFDLFPQVGIAERSDKACADILKGKACILVEGSQLALIAPATITTLLDAGDEHNSNIFFAVFSKILRITALLFALTLSSTYIMVVSFLPETLPATYILALANSRISVPVNSFLEAFIMEIVAELLRESSIRLPQHIGPAVGIVGTIVIGQAAVSAGVVSPLLVIIVSLSTLASFSFPDFTFINSIRILKFMLLIFTAVFGIFGFTMGLTVIALGMISTSSIGTPYTAPIAPFKPKDFINFFLGDITLAKERPDFLETKDKTRQ